MSSKCCVQNSSAATNPPTATVPTVSSVEQDAANANSQADNEVSEIIDKKEFEKAMELSDLSNSQVNMIYAILFCILQFILFIYCLN